MMGLCHRELPLDSSCFVDILYGEILPEIDIILLLTICKYSAGFSEQEQQQGDRDGSGKRQQQR
jgi:hypothetical protein